MKTAARRPRRQVAGGLIDTASMIHLAPNMMKCACVASQDRRWREARRSQYVRYWQAERQNVARGAEQVAGASRWGATPERDGRGPATARSSRAPSRSRPRKPGRAGGPKRGSPGDATPQTRRDRPRRDAPTIGCPVASRTRVPAPRSGASAILAATPPGLARFWPAASLPVLPGYQPDRHCCCRRSQNRDSAACVSLCYGLLGSVRSQTSDSGQGLSLSLGVT